MIVSFFFSAEMPLSPSGDFDDFNSGGDNGDNDPTVFCNPKLLALQKELNKELKVKEGMRKKF